MLKQPSPTSSDNLTNTKNQIFYIFRNIYSDGKEGTYSSNKIKELLNIVYQKTWVTDELLREKVHQFQMVSLNKLKNNLEDHRKTLNFLLEKEPAQRKALKKECTYEYTSSQYQLAIDCAADQGNYDYIPPDMNVSKFKKGLKEINNPINYQKQQISNTENKIKTMK